MLLFKNSWAILLPITLSIFEFLGFLRFVNNTVLAGNGKIVKLLILITITMTLQLEETLNLPMHSRQSIRELCIALDNALEIKDGPDFQKMSQDESKDYAKNRFREFLTVGVHHYIQNNPFQEANDFFNRYLMDEGEAGIKKSHPVLNAYYSFINALDIGRKEEFDVNNLDKCVDKMIFLFGEFLNQGARAFATKTYNPIPNDLGIISYHTSGGPMTEQAQKAIHGLIAAASDAHERKIKELHESYKKPQTLIAKVKGYLTSGK